MSQIFELHAKNTKQAAEYQEQIDTKEEQEEFIRQKKTKEQVKKEEKRQ